MFHNFGTPRYLVKKMMSKLMKISVGSGDRHCSERANGTVARVCLVQFLSEISMYLKYAEFKFRRRQPSRKSASRQYQFPEKQCPSFCGIQYSNLSYFLTPFISGCQSHETPKSIHQTKPTNICIKYPKGFPNPSTYPKVRGGVKSATNYESPSSLVEWN